MSVRPLPPATREGSIRFLRSLRAEPRGVVIYQDVVDHVLAALDEAVAEGDRLREFLEALLIDVRDPDRLGRGMGTDLPYAYDVPPQQARDLLRRIRNAIAREDGVAAEARLQETACPRCSRPGSLTFHNVGARCPLVRHDDEVPLCRPEDT